MWFMLGLWSCRNNEYRICTKSGQKLQTRVSPQHLVTCCDLCDFGCQGGWPSMAFYYWWWSGVPTSGLYDDKNTC